MPNSPRASADTIPDADLCAVLVLDAGGRVVAANRSARQLWAAPDKALVGFPFGGLFGLESVSAEPQSAETQWKALSTATVDRWTSSLARPLSGPPREVRVRLERALGGAGSFIATIQPRLSSR